MIAGQAAADIARQAIAVAAACDDLLPTCIAAAAPFHETLATIGPADGQAGLFSTKAYLDWVDCRWVHHRTHPTRVGYPIRV
jgi:hypothetical protein